LELHSKRISWKVFKENLFKINFFMFLNCFNMLMLIIIFLKNIILKYFRVKNIYHYELLIHLSILPNIACHCPLTNVIWSYIYIYIEAIWSWIKERDLIEQRWIKNQVNPIWEWALYPCGHEHSPILELQWKCKFWEIRQNSYPFSIEYI